MVKGITRQVIVVKSPDPKLFEQAIFLVKDSALTEGGITEEALLREARQVCRGTQPRTPLIHKIFWALSGAVFTGGLFALFSLFSG